MQEQEAQKTAGVTIAPGVDYGFLTDTTVCIGCKACEVACKQWNHLPAEPPRLTATSYDNTGGLGATTWRHVAFIEQFPREGGPSRWLMMSDVCKHCANAGCLEACPTGAIIRTEFGSVYVQQDVCNGCGYCVPACPFGVIALDRHGDGKAHKCTLCYDRLKDGLEPACAKACPTDSIRFGPVSELRLLARRRVEDLHQRGVTGAYVYGDEGIGEVGGLNCFFILTDRPETYNLPPQPRLPSRNILYGAVGAIAGAAALLAGAALAFLWPDRREES